MTIPTPVLNTVPNNIENTVILAQRDAESYHRFVVAKREELAVFERRLAYLEATRDYWEGFQT